MKDATKEFIKDLIVLLFISGFILFLLIGSENPNNITLFILVVIILLQYIQNERKQRKFDALKKNISYWAIQENNELIKTCSFLLKSEYIPEKTKKELEEEKFEIQSFIISDEYDYTDEAKVKKLHMRVQYLNKIILSLDKK